MKVAGDLVWTSRPCRRGCSCFRPSLVLPIRETLRARTPSWREVDPVCLARLNVHTHRRQTAQLVVINGSKYNKVRLRLFHKRGQSTEWAKRSQLSYCGIATLSIMDQFKEIPLLEGSLLNFQKDVFC